MRNKWTAQQLISLINDVTPRQVKIQHRLEEAEIKYGVLKVKKAISLTKETPHDIFYWLDQLEYLEHKGDTNGNKT